MKRREILTIAPAAGVAAMMAGAIPAQADKETPVMALFREWQAATDRLEDLPYDDHAFDVALIARREIEMKLIETPAQGAVDVLAKVCAWTRFGECVLLDGDCPARVFDEMHTALEA